MTRASFLRNLIGLYGVTSIPLQLVKQYQKVYLLQCFVRGFQYYEGPKLIDSINKNGMLSLVREPNNEFDKNAITLHFNNKKIGFIPRESNAILSILLDANLLELQAEITHIEPNADSWENLYIAVYVLKEIDEKSTKEDLEPFSVLETPYYYSLRSKNNTYSRIYFDQNEVDEIIDGTSFYKNLVDKSTTDKIYDTIHTTFADYIELEKAVNDSLFVINKNKYKNNNQFNKFIQTFDEITINIENTFNEKGYVIANVSEIANYPDKIDKFVKIIDKSGSTFYEIVMNL